MGGCMLAIAAANLALSDEVLMRLRPTYYGEAGALMAFGGAWIASGKTFRLIADDELYRPFRRRDGR